jgi:hypothetical protein
VKLALVAAVVLAIAVFVALVRARGERPKAAALGGTMRQRLLAGSAGEFGIAPVGQIWGVLMEMGFAEGWASLVALADGTASLYTSSGGGVIGGGMHAKVKQAAIELCQHAAPLGNLPRVTEFPSPGPQRVRFYLLTLDGVRGAEEPESTLAAGGHRLSALFLAGHAVITQLRVVAEAPVN